MALELKLELELALVPEAQQDLQLHPRPSWETERLEKDKPNSCFASSFFNYCFDKFERLEGGLMLLRE